MAIHQVVGDIQQAVDEGSIAGDALGHHSFAISGGEDYVLALTIPEDRFAEADSALIDATDDLWHRMFDVNVMGTVNAARAFLPVVRSQGHGHLLVTASAAGLLTNLGDAAYSATKHAAVGLAEWLSITHADEGLTVSCLCPQGVNTPLVTGGIGGPGGATLATDVVKLMGLIEPDDVADAVVEGLAEDRFLILPHPEVADYVRTKADNVDRWLDAMRKLQRRLLAT